MKCKTYTATPGLERYPKQERFAKWQAVHKKLLGEDAVYRKRHQSYLVWVIGLSCLMLPFYLPFLGVPLFSLPVNLTLVLGTVAVIVYLAARQMRFMNQRIGQYLQSNPEA